MAFVNSVSVAVSGSTVTTAAVDMATGGANVLIAILEGLSATPVTDGAITDSSGNTYLPLGPWFFNGAQQLRVFVARNVVTSTTMTFTATWTGTFLSGGGLVALGYSGRSGFIGKSGNAIDGSATSHNLSQFGPVASGSDFLAGIVLGALRIITQGSGWTVGTSTSQLWNWQRRDNVSSIVQDSFTVPTTTAASDWMLEILPAGYLGGSVGLPRAAKPPRALRSHPAFRAWHRRPLATQLPQQFSQTLSGSQASASVLVKSVGAIRSALQSSSALVARVINHLLSITQATGATIAKACAAVRSSSAATVATVAKVCNHSFAAIAESAASVLAEVATHLRTVTATVVSAATLGKAVAVARSTAAEVVAAVLSEIHSALRTLSVTVSTTATVAKLVGTVRSVGQAVSVTRTVRIGHTLATVAESLAALLAEVAAHVWTVATTVATAATLSKLVAVTRSSSTTASTALARAISTARSATQATLASLIAQAGAGGVSGTAAAVLAALVGLGHALVIPLDVLAGGLVRRRRRTVAAAAAGLFAIRARAEGLVSEPEPIEEIAPPVPVPVAAAARAWLSLSRARVHANIGTRGDARAALWRSVQIRAAAVHGTAGMGRSVMPALNARAAGRHDTAEDELLVLLLSED